MYRLYILKRQIEDIFIFPFILVGRLIAFLKPLKKDYRLFYFFPFHHIGGAEKVHLQIAKATGGKDTIIFFTRRSHNKGYYEEFVNTNCEIKDISRYTDKKWLYFLNLICRGIISGYINHQSEQPIIFNGQCNFGYKISPWIRNCKQIELIHSLNSFSYIRIPFLPFIDETIMISRLRIQDHLELYKKLKIPEKYIHRIRFISNAMALPALQEEKPDKPITVLYVGRGTPEKRPKLFVDIAEEFRDKNNISFQILGDVSESINIANKSFIHFWGNVTDKSQIANIYSAAHILVIPSETEGFPLAMIEAMAFGLAIIATPVGDIPFHLQNGKTGYLFSTIENEQAIIEEAVVKINKLYNDPELLKKISNHNIQYARQHFDIVDFDRSYQNLLLKKK